MELPIGRGDALDPAFMDIRVGHADIKWIVPHGHHRAHHVGASEDLMPIGQVVHFDPLARMHPRGPSGGTGQRCQAERGIKGRLPRTRPGAGQAIREMPRLLSNERIVQHRKRLKRDGGRIAVRTVQRHQRLIENG